MKKSFVYFITRVGDLSCVKIGVTAGIPYARLKTLQTGCPDELEIHAVIHGTPQDESALHVKFASARIRSEWFRFTGEIKAWLTTEELVPRELWGIPDKPRTTKTRKNVVRTRTVSEAPATLTDVLTDYPEPTDEERADAWDRRPHPLMELCVEIMVESYDSDHLPCLHRERVDAAISAGTDFEGDDEPCKCARQRKRGGVIRKILDQCDDLFDWDDIVDAYADDDEEVLYVTICDATHRNECREFFNDLVWLLDEAGAWAVVFRNASDIPKDRYWTLEHKIFRPGSGYLPQPERELREAQAYMARNNISFADLCGLTAKKETPPEGGASSVDV